MVIGSFNIQNLRLRAEGHLARLTGARNAHPPNPNSDPFLDQADRVRTAAVIRSLDADILALQEVFDIQTLDHFNSEHLAAMAGKGGYAYRFCLPGNDGRGQDVALMSRIAPRQVQSHAHITIGGSGLAHSSWMEPSRPLFCRDCLRVVFSGLTLYVCHLRSNYPDPDQARDIRRIEAAMIRKIIERDFEDPAQGIWMILGDFNDNLVPDETAMGPLIDGFAVDLTARLPVTERWSYVDPETGERYRPDGMLASPALAKQWPNAIPRILRSGMASGHPRASDHAAITIDLPGII